MGKFAKNLRKMGAYRYLQELWKRKQCETMQFVLRLRTWEYRQLPTMHRVTRPSRPDKARRLGYKAKQGVVIYRCAIRRGSRKTNTPKGIIQMKSRKNLRSIAEERVGRKMGALRVLNSYWVGQDGTYKFYEVICVDPAHNAVRNDAKLNWICNPTHKHREIRGLTGAGKTFRGLRKRGDRVNNRRPSKNANYLRRNKINLLRYR